MGLWHCLLHGAMHVEAEPEWEAMLGAGWQDRIMDLAATDDFHAEHGRSTARLVLHTQARFHKDFYLCHFFIRRQDTAHVPDWIGRVHLIDFQRLRRHGFTWPWWLVKDLAQLLYSSDVDGIEARDRLSFWRAYLG